MLKVLEKLNLLLTAEGGFASAPDGTGHHPLGRTPLWAYENPVLSAPFANPDAPAVFEVLDEDAPAETLLEKTSLAIFLGAQDTPLFRRCLERGDLVLAVFDTDPARVARFAASVGPDRLAEVPVPVFIGHPSQFAPALAKILPHEMFQAGFPVFFTLDGQDEAFHHWADAVAEELEVLFYRYRIYPLTGQFNARGRPIRPMKRQLFFDQLYHGYANSHRCLTANNLEQAKGSLTGETAIVAAAGPALSDQLDWLREQRDRAVVIAVNNAMGPLLNAGIEPHFCVLNDNSLLVDGALEKLPPSRTMLAAHCLSALGGDRFEKAFLFGIWMPGVFGLRPELELYASVVTAGFSLARFLGCAQCVFAGVQLAGQHPFGLGYARGTVHDDRDTRHDELTHRWPQLYPVRSAAGNRLFTSLNFLDAAHWFLDEIRASGMDCVNTCADSLLHGPGVRFDPEPEIPPSERLRERIDALRELPPPTLPAGPVLQFVEDEMNRWNKTSALCSSLLRGSDDELLRTGAKVLAQFDETNVSYLVQRFEDFRNSLFHRGYFDSDDRAARAEALRYYFDHVRRMAASFASVLRKQRRRLRET